MKTWIVTLRTASLLGSPNYVKVTANRARINRCGALEFWLGNGDALIPSWTLLRAFPPGWADVQLLDEQSADSKDIGDMLANDTRRTLRVAGGLPRPDLYQEEGKDE